MKAMSNSMPKARHGNTLIIVVIIILFAVGAVIFLNSTTKVPTGPVDECPWVESHRILEDYAGIHLPKPPQITISEEKSIKYPITSDEGQNRGRLEIVISPDGLVVAAWQARYKEDVYEKEFTATCQGNVDADRLYENEDGADPSRLFFITEGRFVMQAFKHGNASLGGGEAYVVGWVSPDGSANGTLVLTPDKKTTRIYRWGS